LVYSGHMGNECKGLPRPEAACKCQD
jgi:hypothetical protein